MHIETTKKIVDQPIEKVFEFLSDIKNFETLMPDNISKFEVLDENTFKFALTGMPEIVLRLKEKKPFNEIVLGAASDKLPFTLSAVLTSLAPDQTEVGLAFEGEFNAMMAMMIKTPITNFMTALTTNMSKIV